MNKKVSGTKSWLKGFWDIETCLFLTKIVVEEDKLTEV